MTDFRALKQTTRSRQAWGRHEHTASCRRFGPCGRSFIYHTVYSCIALDTRILFLAVMFCCRYWNVGSIFCVKASQDIPSDSYPPLVVVGELIDVSHFPDRWRAVFAPARAHVTDDRGQHIKDEAKTKAYRQAASLDTCRLLYLLAFVLAPLNTPLSLPTSLRPLSLSI